jgi:hypothetical protein
MKVLIVAKTMMKGAYCVGGYDMENKKNIRLLMSNESNQPLDTKFEIGQIWNIDYVSRSKIIYPHSEDVLIQDATFYSNIHNIADFLKENVNIWRGSPDVIFDNKIFFQVGKSGVLDSDKSLNYSVGFWIADKDLELSILDNQKHYIYFDCQPYFFPYVGLKDRIERIPKGTVLRVSLTRWWSPNKDIFAQKCYCQLSGWY